MNKHYIKAIDAMRVVSISAVVLVHTTTRVLEATHYDLVSYPWTLFLNQVFRFAVPLFFLISGFVLELSAEHDLNYFTFLKKRFTKIFIPYVFWSLIYYYLIYTGNTDNLIRVILTGNASYQLYFIPTLCIFYIMFPLLHKIYKFIAHPITLFVLGAAQFWLLYEDYFIKHGGSDYPTRIALLSFFVFLLGIIAARNKDKIFAFAKKWKYLLGTAAVASAIYVFAEGMTFYYKIYNIGAIYSQYRPSILVYTVMLALILYVVFEKTDWKRISELSYFVFFIHVVILEAVWSFFGKTLFNIFSTNVIGKIVFDPILFLSVGGLSFLIAWLVRKIPYISRLTG